METGFEFPVRMPIFPDAPAFEPFIPTRGTKVSGRPEWIHEVKRDDHASEGKRVRLFTRNGRDWNHRCPLIREAALRNRQSSFVVDGEVVLLGIDGRLRGPA